MMQASRQTTGTKFEIGGSREEGKVVLNTREGVHNLVEEACQ